jgi:hypothetical protein
MTTVTNQNHKPCEGSSSTRIQQPQEIQQGYWDVTTTCCYSVTKDYAGARFDQTTNTIIQ